jgi:deazaflavin-dependent oxidoreductase (nitroreductase family)
MDVPPRPFSMNGGTMPGTLMPPVRSTAIGRGGAWALSNRALMRAPVGLYRARLGFLFGSRTLMLEHVGRKSGARRYVVLEVIGHPAPDTYVVASGFGERAQWYRNLMARPHGRVSVAGHGPRAAAARRLPAGEADAALADYVRRHPRAWAKFKNVLEHTLGTAISEHHTPLPMIELRLSARPDA